MQPVGADDQIDFTRGGMIKADTQVVTLIFDTSDGVTEDRLDLSVNARQIVAARSERSRLVKRPLVKRSKTSAEKPPHLRP